MNDESEKKNFDIILYLEDKLNFKEKKIFEESLLKSPDKLNFLLELKKDMFLMENLTFQKVSDELLNKVLETVREKDTLLQKDWGNILLKLTEKGFELIKDTFSLTPPIREIISYRDNEKGHEKIIFSHDEIELTFVLISNNKLNLNINFNTKKVINENVLLYKKLDNDLRMVASIKPINNKVNFTEILPSNYIIKLKELDLFFSVMEN
ncbi:MAG: hypothetical protein OEV44_14755 [Spirochaetota bacterium]|nr:hypothetical protein [Spirochaetota bacterium]